MSLLMDSIPSLITTKGTGLIVSDDSEQSDQDFTKYTENLFSGMDESTYLHSVGVGKISAHFIKMALKNSKSAIDFNDEERDFIAKTSDKRLERIYAMHDVGKTLPSIKNVLQKNGDLSYEEWKIMYSHTTEGAAKIKILSRQMPGQFQESMDWAYQIAYGHHQTFNGNGRHYPGPRITDKNSVIIAFGKIGDLIDALYSPRNYKEEWTTGRVMEEIIKLYNQGQLHPDVATFVFHHWGDAEVYMEMRKKEWESLQHPNIDVANLNERIKSAKSKEETAKVTDGLLTMWGQGQKIHTQNIRTSGC